MTLARNAKNGVPFRSALQILFKEILVGLEWKWTCWEILNHDIFFFPSRDILMSLVSLWNFLSQWLRSIE